MDLRIEDTLAYEATVHRIASGIALSQTRATIVKHSAGVSWPNKQTSISESILFYASNPNKIEPIFNWTDQVDYYVVDDSGLRLRDAEELGESLCSEAQSQKPGRMRPQTDTTAQGQTQTVLVFFIGKRGWIESNATRRTKIDENLKTAARRRFGVDVPFVHFHIDE